MNNMLKYIMAVLCLSLFGACMGQKENTSTKIFEEEGFNRGDQILSVEDGFIILGYSHVEDEYGLWLLKINEKKEEVWRKSYSFGKDNYVLPHGLLEIKEGYLIFGDVEYSKEKTSKIVLLKTNKSGEREWQEYYPGFGYASGESILSVEDGFIFLGTTVASSGNESMVYPLLIKIDERGNTQWYKTYGKGNRRGSVLCTAAEGYLIAGTKGALEDTLQLTKVSSTGKELWSEEYKGTEAGWPLSVFSLDDGFVIAGYSSRHSGDFLLMKVDKNGNELWSKRYDNEYEIPLDAIKVEDGFVMVGATSPDIEAEKDILVIKTDRKGNEKWRKIYGGEKDQIAYSVCERDGDLFVVGLTRKKDKGDTLLIEIE
ncbi:MAG: hypothetical protein U9N35_01565 [Euryarchaeota archaeon]|nr:hypothetical protein [Euryarchaeota archaeon]